MKIRLNGSPEDLIKRCEGCDYCIFEHILPEEQRKIKVLDKPIPERHVHRGLIEQICGKNYDGVCPMKYAVMRSPYDDFMAAQLGAVKNLIWDLGKQKKQNFDYEEALREWTKLQHLGNGKLESYAERFREVWEKGLRKNEQILTTTYIYELVVSEFETYKKGIELLENLKQEHLKRDNI